MPRELTSVEEIDEKLLSRTSLVYRKAVKEGVKYKFRTKRTMFTYLADVKKTAEIEDKINTSGFSIEIIEA